MQTIAKRLRSVLWSSLRHSAVAAMLALLPGITMVSAAPPEPPERTVGPKPGPLVVAPLEAARQPLVAHLPEWMRPLYGQGLLAQLDENHNVVSVTVGAASDELLKQLTSLPQLKVLDINAEKGITKAGLIHLGQLSQLEKLNVYGGHFEGASFGDEVIGNVVPLKSLGELSITECGTTDVGARLLERIPQLTTLSLRQEGRLTDNALRSIGKLTRLESLSLDSYVATERFGWMRFSAEGTRQLAALRELRMLRLVGQEVSADTIDFPKLTSLGLGHPSVGDDVAVKIGKHRGLEHLELTYCRISDDGLKSIAALPALRSLSISSTAITDQGLAHLDVNGRLEHISLRIEGVTDRTLEHLAGISSLTRLDLYGSGRPGVSPGRRFSAEGLKQLGRLPKLDTLYLTNFEHLAWRSALVDLKQLRELSLMMCNATDQELESLETVLPNTRISHMTGGGGWISKNGRRQAE